MNDPEFTEIQADLTAEVGQDGSAAEAGPNGTDVLARLLAGMAALQEDFDSKIRYDGVRELQVEALHQELEMHRKGLYQQILRPLLTDLIGIYDDVTNVLAGPGAADTDGHEGQRSVLARAVDSLRDSVDEILRRNGVTTFVVEDDGIERSRQRVIELTDTDQPELDRRVACRLRPGFELDGKVFRPEWVRAYRYVASRDSAGSGQCSQTGDTGE